MHRGIQRNMTRSLQAFSIILLSALPLAAQTPTLDTSGNSLLNGTYYFRHVIYAVSNQADAQTGFAGDITQAIAVYGNIAFDGNGNYSISGSAQVDDSSSQVGTVALSCYLARTSCTSGTAVAGTYAISSSGYGYVANPIVPADVINGLVSSQNHVFMASSTETGYSYSDVFMAAPVASPVQSNATFSGTYTVAGFFPGGSPVNSANAFFQVTADGNGNLGTVNVSGAYGGGGTTVISQSNANIKYSFLNGAGVVTWPTSSTANFFSGSEYFYFSPDGNFFFGGAPFGGYDIIVGVRNGSGAQNFAGLYYEAGIDQNVSTLQSAGYADFDGYFGSFKALASGDIVAHDRISSIFNSNPVGSSYYDGFTPPVNGTYNSGSFQYAIGANGAIRIGAAVWPGLGITAAVQQPPFTPNQSVYIDPSGVVNAASFAPFTAGIANGEFLAIYGTNLSAQSATAASYPFPTKLANVQVFINGAPAPIYYVTPGQISVISPGSDPYAIANIQVLNNGNASNIVSVPLNNSAPGVFTVENNGIGHAAALHGADLSLVTAANPAAPGETIAVYVNGLGPVFPTPADGSPATGISNVTNAINADIGGTPANVVFQGLAPGYAGLYQVNLTIPSTLTAGTYNMDIGTTTSKGGPDAYSSESIINVGSGAGATSARPAARPAKTLKPTTHRHAVCEALPNQDCTAPSARLRSRQF
jgi:uncharacterized protein (TIGR03437 family)